MFSSASLIYLLYWYISNYSLLISVRVHHFEVVIRKSLRRNLLYLNYVIGACSSSELKVNSVKSSLHGNKAQCFSITSRHRTTLSRPLPYSALTHSLWSPREYAYKATSSHFVSFHVASLLNGFYFPNRIIRYYHSIVDCCYSCCYSPSSLVLVSLSAMFCLT